MGNIFPEILCEMRKAYLAGDKEKAMEYQYQILALRAITKTAPTVPIMHAILAMRGVDSGLPRSPYIEIDEGLKSSIKAQLVKAGVI